MANANPSGPGRLTPADLNRRPEVNIQKGDFIVKLDNGTTVHRRTFTTGNYVDSLLSGTEGLDVITEKQFKAKWAKLNGEQDG